MFKKVGAWKKVHVMTHMLATDLETAKRQSLSHFAEHARKQAVEHISRQDLPWIPLNSAYRARKTKEGHSDQIYVKTGSYFQSITSWVSGGTAYAGVKKTVRNKKGEEVANIARVLEYGASSVGIPARPLWKPSLQETIRWHKKNNLPSMIYRKLVRKRYGV